MSLTPDAVRLLSCPFCTTPLGQRAVLEESATGVEFGLLTCDACGFDYPVVGGIAIIGGPNDTLDSKEEASADSVIRGPRIAELVALLAAKKPAQALNRLLNPSALRGRLFPELGPGAPDARPSTAVALATRVDRLLGRRYRGLRRLAKQATARVALPRARARLGAYLSERGTQLTAVDVLDLYYRRYSGAEISNYFVYRFGQPRHLSALGLASLLNTSDGPVLDLACGVGHLTHFFTASRPGRVVLGADRDFFRLFVAHRYVAPAASFVCVAADRALPFSEGALDAVFCSDAFHFFLYRATAVRELRRVLRAEGLAVVARVGNAAVEPREGYELRVDGYRRLFSPLEHVIVGEETALASYLEMRTPELAAPETDAQLAPQKWLSVVARAGASASSSRRAFPPSASFSTFPHAAGRLALNPIYAVDARTPAGDLELRLVFPSQWYRFENEAYLRYAPERVRVSADVVRALATGAAHPDLAALVRQCVVVGMPERYRVSPLAP